MNDLAKQLFDTGVAINRAVAEQLVAEQHQIEAAPRIVYLLWHQDNLLGVCGTQVRAEQEKAMYESLPETTGEIHIEGRVVHS